MAAFKIPEVKFLIVSSAAGEFLTWTFSTRGVCISHRRDPMKKNCFPRLDTHGVHVTTLTDLLLS